MPGARILVVAGAMVLTGGLAACGTGSSSTPAVASKADFCRAFDTLSSRAKPSEAADRLSQVGAPRDMDSSARHGLEVLVDHLRDLPDKADPGDITSMVRNLHPDDGADVRAFIDYYAQECQGFPTDTPS
jgi:hypothetical protein